MKKGLLVAILLACGSAFAVPPQSVVKEDWGGNLPATNKDFFPNSFPTIEVNVPNPMAPAIVFKRGATATLKLTWRNPVNASDSGTFVISNVRFVRNNGQVIPLTVNGGSSHSEPVSIPPLATYDTSTMTIAGLPNYVTKGSIQYVVQVLSPFGLTGGGGRGYNTYLTYDTPVGHQQIPWTNMLSLSCGWADGLSTPSAICQAATFGLYYSQQFYYTGQPGLPPSWITQQDKFKLTDFFNTPGYKSGNCSDVAAFNLLSFASLGIVTNTTLLEAPAGPFVTYPVCPIGSDSTNLANYFRIRWILHVVCVNPGSLDTYDACTALVTDLFGAGYQNPPAGWFLGTGGYWQKNSGIPSPMFYGLVSRYAGSTDTAYNVVDPSPPDQSVPLNPTSVPVAGIL